MIFVHPAQTGLRRTGMRTVSIDIGCALWVTAVNGVGVAAHLGVLTEPQPPVVPTHPEDLKNAVSNYTRQEVNRPKTSQCAVPDSNRSSKKFFKQA